MPTQYFSVHIGLLNLGVQMLDQRVLRIEAIADTLNMPADNACGRAVAAQLQAYAERGDTPLDFPLTLHGTDFQQRVWRALQRIPPGQVQTYGALARRLSTSARAVGNACRRNPVLLAVPCHRVVSASGLGGFAGNTQGKWPAIKRRLLAHEGLSLD